MQVTFLGGIGEYARTCILIKGKQHSILLDCGTDKAGTTKIEQYPLLTEEIATSLDFVLLSHSHEDHSSGLPYLYALGFKGKVICSAYTKQQVPSYFSSWRKMNHNKHIPLPYVLEDEEAIQFLTFQEPTGERSFEAFDLLVKWGSSGHILGSVWYDLQFEGKRIFFSGDYHTESSLYCYVEPEEGKRDLAILDTAYGIDKTTRLERAKELEILLASVEKLRENVLLPLPRFGRSQEVLLFVQTILKKKMLEDYQIILENNIWQPLKEMATESEWLKEFNGDYLSERISIVNDEQERRLALKQESPKLIFTTDGMLQSEHAQFYFHQLIEDRFFHIVFTGHLAAQTIGHKIFHAPSTKYQAHKITINVHPSINETEQLLLKLNTDQSILTHNFKPNNDKTAAYLMEKGFKKVHSLQSGQTLHLY